MEGFVFCIAFGAAVVGAVCGIGGGVICKPLLDLFRIASVAEISFLSSCMVISMSCYSVVKALMANESLVLFLTGTPLAIGAAIGGIMGRKLFSLLLNVSVYPDQVGGYQAICLVIVTTATLMYNLSKKHVKTLKVRNPLICIVIGLILGVMSSFLGIGGGPMNLVVLHFFFSMGTKEGAQNSLYIILISQIASILTSIVTTNVPEIHLGWLIAMILGGITGGMLGRKLNMKLNEVMVDKLFSVLILVIIGIGCYNAWSFLG